MKKEFLCLLAPIIMLGTGACASGNTSESVVVVGEDKEVGAGASESVVEGQAEDGAELDTGELQKFTDYFQEPANNFFLTTAYDCPENIDWSGLLEHEVVGHQVSPEEADAFLKVLNSCWFGPECGASGVSADDLNEYIKEHAGITYEQCNNKPDWTYIKELDSFYVSWDVSQWGALISYYKCTSGTKQGDVYTLNFEEADDKDYYTLTPTRLTLKEEDGKYHVVSNELLWEEGKEKFECDMLQFGGKCEFRVYPSKEDKGCNVLVLKDGNSKGEFIPDVFVNGASYSFKEITDIKTFDYDADGKSDIVVTGKTDAGDAMTVYNVGNDNYYEHDRFFDEHQELLSASAGFDGLKDKMYADNKEDKFDTFNTAYAQIAYINKMLNEKCTFDIMYVDEDNMPELVVDQGTEWDLYTFGDGHAVSLGTYLNRDGYVSEYSEKKNVIRNRSVDFEKGDYSEPISYSFISKGTIRFSYTINSDYLNEEKVNSSDIGILTPGLDYYSDPNNKFEVGVNIPYASYVYDADKSRAEVENNIRKLEDLEYVPFSGKMTYKELKNELGLK